MYRLPALLAAISWFGSQWTMEQITHHPENTTPPPTDTLSSDECWVLLESESFGRLAVAAAGEIEIFPVNYAADDGSSTSAPPPAPSSRP